jgi:hypothetical protein
MFGKLSVWISALVVATTLALGGSAQANTLSNVSTRIIPNWNNSGSDVCFVHNSNNVPVSAVISVFPMGTAVFGIDNWTFPVLLGAFGGTKVFSWTPPKHAGSCKVLLVQ